MGFQFVHVESYSRKADDKGRSSSFVLDEAERRPEACTHVESPAPPVLVFGVPVAEVRVLHDQQIAEATTTTKAGKTRRIRSDQHTLMTVIASHPISMEEVRADPAKAAEVEDWQSRTIDWLRDRWGDRLVSVIRHDDESHPHLHAYLLPADPEMRARQMHPGVVAKAEAKARAEAEGLDLKASNAAGDRAYKEAMRRMQNSYFEQVGVACGLARMGPGRRRLTRAEWQMEKAGVQAAAVVVRAAEEARERAEVERAEAERARREAEASREAERAARERAVALVIRGQDYVQRVQGKAAEQAAAIKAEAEATAAARIAAAEAELERACVEAATAKVEATTAKQEAEAAKSEAASARAELGKLRRIGERLGSLLLSVVGQSPAQIARRAAEAARAEERERMRAEVEKARDERRWANSELTRVQGENAALRASVGGLAQQRDAAQAQLAKRPSGNRRLGPP